jgi:hypothetical protein
VAVAASGGGAGKLPAAPQAASFSAAFPAGTANSATSTASGTSATSATSAIPAASAASAAPATPAASAASAASAAPAPPFSSVAAPVALPVPTPVAASPAAPAAESSVRSKYYTVNFTTALGLLLADGMKVKHVEVDSAARAFGVQPGDVLYSANGVIVSEKFTDRQAAAAFIGACRTTYGEVLCRFKRASKNRKRTTRQAKALTAPEPVVRESHRTEDGRTTRKSKKRKRTTRHAKAFTVPEPVLPESSPEIKTYAVVDGETIDKAWVKYRLELCTTWIQVIVEKYADGKPNEALQYLNLVHKELIKLGRLANEELLANSGADVGGIDSLFSRMQQTAGVSAGLASLSSSSSGRR